MGCWLSTWAQMSFTLYSIIHLFENFPSTWDGTFDINIWAGIGCVFVNILLFSSCYYLSINYPCYLGGAFCHIITYLAFGNCVLEEFVISGNDGWECSHHCNHSSANSFCCLESLTKITSFPVFDTLTHFI